MATGMDSYTAQQTLLHLSNPVTTWEEHAKHADDRVSLAMPLLFRRVGSRAGKPFLPKESFGVEVWKLCASKIGRVALRMWYGCSITVGC